jgi:hypothetical protein
VVDHQLVPVFDHTARSKAHGQPQGKTSKHAPHDSLRHIQKVIIYHDEKEGMFAVAGHHVLDENDECMLAVARECRFRQGTTWFTGGWK